MGLIETEALVLRTYNLAEADKIVVCLTRAAGLVRGVARGSRRIKNRFGAALEPFTLLDLTYYQKENQELVSLRNAEILRSHFGLFRDPQILPALAYLGDLLVEFSPPHQTNDKLFRMVTACLETLTQTPHSLQSILRYFEIWILRLEGFLPDLRTCGECHRTFSGQEAVQVSRELGLLCRPCAQGKYEVLSRGAYVRLCASQTESPLLFAQHSREASAQIQLEIAELMNRMIGRVLDRRPRIQPSFQLAPSLAGKN
jgi:DNA repair protein RecO (recombination protein O)